MTLDEAIQHARDKAAEGGDCAEDHKQLATWLEELVAANARITELAGMLNGAKDEGKIQAENERDACVRKVQFLLEASEEGSGSEDRLKALQHVIDCLNARKDRGVQMIDEMTNGTMLGEFIEAHVERAVEQFKARFKAPPDSRPDDGREQNPGWHGLSFIAEANMATGDQLTNDAAELDAQADTGYYDNTCGSDAVLRTMAAWLRQMDARGQ